MKKIFLALIALLAVGFLALSFVKIPAPKAEVRKEIDVALG